MGAGAGYDVTIKGIELDRNNWKLINDEFEERYGSHTVTVEVPVKPCIAEEWAAEDYYYGVDSTNGIVLDGICVLDYYDEDKKIDGGVATLSMEVYPEYTDDVLSQEELNEAIGNLLPSELDLTTPYGGGWSHADLPEEGIVFDDDNGRINLDEGETYDYTTVRCELKCPNISSNINWFFENDYKLEDIFFEQEPEEEEDDDEITNSHKPVKSGVDKGTLIERINEIYPDDYSDWSTEELQELAINIGVNIENSRKPVKSSITQRELKDMIHRGQAIDITYDENSLPEGVRLDVLQISKGTYGMNGALFKGSDGNLYAIAGRTSNLFRWV